jgi:hypothetical protein
MTDGGFTRLHGLGQIAPDKDEMRAAAGALARDRGKLRLCGHDSRRLQPEVLREWIDRYPFQLKFVLESAADLSEMEELLQRIGRPIPPSKVLVMPQGIDVRTIRDRDETLIDVCLNRGYRYCNRLHIEIFGNKRGTSNSCPIASARRSKLKMDICCPSTRTSAAFRTDTPARWSSRSKQMRSIRARWFAISRW